MTETFLVLCWTLHSASTPIKSGCFPFVFTIDWLSLCRLQLMCVPQISQSLNSFVDRFPYLVVDLWYISLLFQLEFSNRTHTGTHNYLWLKVWNLRGDVPTLKSLEAQFESARAGVAGQSESYRKSLGWGWGAVQLNTEPRIQVTPKLRLIMINRRPKR